MKFPIARICLVVFLFLSAQVFSQAPVANFTADIFSGCVPVNVTFQDLSTNSPTSWSWSIQDSTPATSTNQNPQHTFQYPGKYTVSLTVTNSFGSDTKTFPLFITAFKFPIPYYTISDDTICSGQSITFTDSTILGDAGIDSLKWSFNDFSTLALGNPVSHTYSNISGNIENYKAVLTVVDSNGCVSVTNSTSSIPVYVLPQPFASFTPNPAICAFPTTLTFSNSSSGPQLYSWDFGDPSSGANNFSNLATPAHTYNSPGQYLVTLINGVTGCSAQDTMTINLVPPIANFTCDTIVCVGEPLTITNLSTNSLFYNWNFGDQTFSTDPNPIHTYTAFAIRTIRLVASSGTCVDTMFRQVLVPKPPDAIWQSSNLIGCSVPFTVNYTDTNSTHAVWSWNFDDPGSPNNTSNVANPTHVYNSQGVYDVSLAVIDIYGCMDTIVHIDTVNIVLPIAYVNELMDSGCVGESWTFSGWVDSPNDSGAMKYTWDFGDGTVYTDTDSVVTHQYNTAGIWDLTLTITTPSGCTATTTLAAWIKVGTPPIAEIDSVPGLLCFQKSFTFHDLSHPQPITGWLWNFGDGQSSTEQNPNHIYEYDTSGVQDPFDIILIAYYNGCADTDTVVNMITVLSPIPFFTPVYNCINQDSLFLQNLSQGADTFMWDFGHGTPTSNDTDAIHIFPGRGTYAVTLTATNIANGCIVDTIIDVHVYDVTPVISTPVDSACHPGTIFFSGLLSLDADTLWWDFGDPGSPLNTAVIYNVIDDTLHTYDTTGYYTAKLLIQDPSGCRDSVEKQIHIIGPYAQFSAAPLTGCLPPFPGFNVTFTDNSIWEGKGIASRVWNFGEGDPNVPTPNTTISNPYDVAGLYTVSLTVIDSNGCIDTYTAPGLVNPTKPHAMITNSNLTGCRNQPINFFGSAGLPGEYLPPVLFEWTFGDGSTFSSNTDSTIFHTYTGNGVYNVTLKVTDANGCTDNTQIQMDVFTTSAHFTYSSTTICADDNGVKRANVQATFLSDSTQHTTNANYDWDLTVVHYPVNHTHDPTFNFNVVPGTYPVQLILTNDFGCKDTFLSPDPIIIPGPTGSFSFVPDSGCTPLTVTFTGDTTDYHIYAWDFGDGNIILGTAANVVTHTYSSVGNYIPHYLMGFPVANDFCYLTCDTVGIIKATSLLVVNILEDTVEIPPKGGKGTFTVEVTDPNNLGNYTYNWTPANDVTQGPTSNTFIATGDVDSAYYYVSIPYQNSGCSGIDSVWVYGNPCELNWDSIPNVFTPNGDFRNDTYYIKDLCNYENFYIRIYNRWGRIIFESDDPYFEWDGTNSGGTLASDGVYYYTLTAKKKDYHGYIQLIRAKL